MSVAPPIAALELAAEWLDAFDEESAGAGDCYAVAKWLRDRAAAAAKRHAEAEAIRSIAAERGTSPTNIRRQLAEVRRRRRRRLQTAARPRSQQ